MIARLKWLCAATFLMVLASSATAGPRPAAVAGAFYPDDAGKLNAVVSSYLNEARPAGGERPVALISPHAGYIYSGQIAADAYRQAVGYKYDVILIVGPNHRVSGFYDISVYDGPGYETPLGVAACAQDLAATLRDLDRRFVYRPDVHTEEHSVEVQVPFVQTVFPGIPIVTAVIGSNDPDLWIRFGKALASTFAQRRVLLIASTDLSHYPTYDVACASDRAVLEAVATVDASELMKAIRHQEQRHQSGLDTCACGEGPMVAVLAAAGLLGATRADVVSYANSGDTAVGDRHRCVGYGAVVLTRGTSPSNTDTLEPIVDGDGGAGLTDDDRQALLTLARRTLEQYFATGTTPLARDASPALSRQQGAFVTLKSNGHLRGCIGHMAEDRPLQQVVSAMAINAAFKDHRFTQLQSQEMGLITIEISVLTPFSPIRSADDIVLGRDGVVIRKSGRSAVFLPQVATEQGWTRDEMLDRLCRKAGLSKGDWQEGAQLLTFQADVFGEPERH